MGVCISAFMAEMPHIALLLLQHIADRYGMRDLFVMRLPMDPLVNLYKKLFVVRLGIRCSIAYVRGACFHI